jgi:hypothetical protein
MEFFSLHVIPNATATSTATAEDGPDFILVPEAASHLAGWFAGPLWFAYHGLYLAMLGDAAVLLAMAMAFKYFAFTKWGILVFLLAERYLVASFANDIRRLKLARDGYEERGTILAEDETMADAFALDQLLASAHANQAPDTPTPEHLPHAPAHPARRGPLRPFASPFENS